MDDNYKINKEELAIHNENIALDKFDSIVSNSSIGNVSFIKKTNEFVKIRDRKTEPNISTLFSITWNRIGILNGLKTQTNYEIAQDITNLVFSYHSELSMEEIYKAFELERFSVYDVKTEHFQLFNAEYVAVILKKYKVWKQNMRLIHERKNFGLNQLLPEKTSSQIKETMDNAILRKFNEYKETGAIEEPFVYIFDELYDRKILKNPTHLTPNITEYYNNKLEIAKKRVKAELRANSFSSSKEKTDIKEELKKISNGNTDKAQILAKKLVLIDFFDKHINLKTDMNNLITK